MPSTQELQDLTTQVRRDILRMVHKVNSGHPGGSLGCAEFLVTLYNEIMDLKPVFGHPTTHEGLPGIRMASGSLGQGLSNAIGAAQAKKMNNDSHLVYSLHGDGELQEGQNWEAIMYASAKGVDNLIATVDLNGKQIDGPTEEVLNMGDVKAKFEAFDWLVLEVKEGNNIEALIEGINKAKSLTGKGKPVCVLMETEMGNGVDFMMHTHAWHGQAPNDEQLADALNQNKETLGDY